ncbi:MAG: AzlD domain-containing protein [Acutalibacteraceae bacterium]|jgi:branched-subunit amino acid transport protein
MTLSATGYYLIGVAVMAFVTYLPRVWPLALVRKKVENRFVRSFLAYMPVAVLGAMTVPAIFYATATPWSALAGMATALVMAYFRLPLLPVAVASTVTVWIVERILGL